MRWHLSPEAAALGGHDAIADAVHGATYKKAQLAFEADKAKFSPGVEHVFQPVILAFDDFNSFG